MDLDRAEKHFSACDWNHWHRKRLLEPRLMIANFLLDRLQRASNDMLQKYLILFSAGTIISFYFFLYSSPEFRALIT